MRKRLSLSLVLVLGLVGCYPNLSMRRAKRACLIWEQEKTIIKVNGRIRTSRYCEGEREASQVLGFLNKTIEDGKFKENSIEGEYKVVKVFKYRGSLFFLNNLN